MDYKEAPEVLKEERAFERNFKGFQLIGFQWISISKLSNSVDKKMIKKIDFCAGKRMKEHKKPANW